MFPPAHSMSGVHLLSADPANHGSNPGVVAASAFGILVLIGLIVFLITRRGGRR